MAKGSLDDLFNFIKELDNNIQPFPSLFSVLIKGGLPREMLNSIYQLAIQKMPATGLSPEPFLIMLIEHWINAERPIMTCPRGIYPKLEVFHVDGYQILLPTYRRPPPLPKEPPPPLPPLPPGPPPN